MAPARSSDRSPSARYASAPAPTSSACSTTLVISELGLRSAAYEIRVADPELFIPFDDGTAFVEYVDDERTAAGLRELGVSEADIEGFLDYRETFDRARRKLRKGARDSVGRRLPLAGRARGDARASRS